MDSTLFDIKLVPAMQCYEVTDSLGEFVCYADSFSDARYTIEKLHRYEVLYKLLQKDDSWLIQRRTAYTETEEEAEHHIKTLHKGTPVKIIQTRRYT